jgi:hypothetical protein
VQRPSARVRLQVMLLPVLALLGSCTRGGGKGTLLQAASFTIRAGVKMLRSETANCRCMLESEAMAMRNAEA